ncbi:retropepsin-like aspartic protease, partial [Acinetobacter baumannii]|nr:retropepsin-like aspartic protease [Acinetobacter baumannii]
VTLTASDTSLPVVALLDSGSAGNFISGTLCRQLNIKTTATPTTYQIRSVTGESLSRKHIRRCTEAIQIQVGLLHVEHLHLLVL